MPVKRAVGSKRPTAPAATTNPTHAPPGAVAGHVFTLLGAPMSGTNSKRWIKRGKTRFLVPSEGASAWKAAMVAQLVQQYRRPAIAEPVALTLHFYRGRDVGDVDNFAKPVMDALQTAGVLVNDSQVCELHLFRCLDRENPRTLVALTRRAA